MLITRSACCAALAILTGGAAANTVALRGDVALSNGVPLARVLVTARAVAAPLAVTMYSDDRGRFEIRDLPDGVYRVEAQLPGYTTAARDSVPAMGAPLHFVLSPAGVAWRDASSATLLRLLPDGETKRQFVLDCTGCHQVDQRTISSGERVKTRAEWQDWIGRMLAFAGATTSFPIMSPGRDPRRTAEWLVATLGEGAPPTLRPAPPPLTAAGPGRARITEFDLPDANDLPHDVAVAADGRVVVTGMSSHRMYVLDPATATFTAAEIPVESANPRAVEIDSAGTWWVLLGSPQRLARFTPATGAWTTWALGMYPHSLGRDGTGRVWFNGHFTKNPELLGSVDPATGTVSTVPVPTPPMPDGGSTIPYELRVAPDGAVWVSQLAGNRLVRFTPATGRFTFHTLPSPHAGPRRFDFDAEGNVWVPEYAANKLARFDPRSERFKEFEFPLSDALPYVVRVDRARGVVWIATAAADAVARFDPRSGRFTVFPLPTRGALIRHLDIDARTGAVWGAYSPAPARAPRIVRIEAP